MPIAVNTRNDWPIGKVSAAPSAGARNGALHGVYHLHQPWGIGASILSGLVYAFPSWRLRTTWMGVIAHSAQSIFFAFLILGVVLGLA